MRELNLNETVSANTPAPRHSHFTRSRTDRPLEGHNAVFFLLSDPVQDASRTASGKNFLDGPPRVLQPFLTHRAKLAGAPPSLPGPVRNTMLAAALFPEFLKELAALAQEHSILCCKVLGDLDDSCC